MSKLLTLIMSSFLATSAFAAELNETDVKAFLADWLAAQNTGSYSSYAAMYSKSFSGIRRSGENIRKLNHDAWLADRKKMFNKKMVVQANNPEIQISGPKATIKFEQIWESNSYKDKGDKLLTVTVENKKLIIIGETLLSSQVVAPKDSDASVASKRESSRDNRLLSEFTPIVAGKCTKLPKQLNKNLAKQGLYGDECPAPKGWRLFVVVGGDRSWIDIANKNLIWTTEQEVVYREENYFGYFPNITSKQVEWRVDKDGVPNSLIFPVTAQDPEHVGKSITRYFIVNIDTSTPSFCGTAKNEKSARNIADTANTCTTILPKRSFAMEPY